MVNDRVCEEDILGTTEETADFLVVKFDAMIEDMTEGVKSL